MDWKDIAIGIAPFLGGFVVLRALDKPEPPPPLPPALAPAAPPGTAGGPIQLLNDPVIAVPGKTYFASVNTSGVVSAAANPANVEAKARELGFTDVVVFTQRPSTWPSTGRADYYVRGTYSAAQPRNLARRNNVFLGSVEVTDVFETT